MNDQSATTRRRFFFQAGAALSVPLAVAGARASGGAPDDAASEAAAELQSRLALLEDINAIRELHLAYARYVNGREYAEIPKLFADPAAASVDVHLSGIAPDRPGQQEAIEVSADRAIATARIHCRVDFETPIAPSCPLVEMAREQGGGIVRRSERGVLDNVYVRRHGTWKIKHLAFRPA